MRKALPWILLSVAVVIGLVVWQTEGFGLLPQSGSGDVVPADRTPDAADAGDVGLKGRAGIDPDKDPKTFEGDPVGAVELGKGTAAVTGRVIDAASGAPVRFARVSPVPTTAEEARVAVRTTKEGRFEIRGLPAGPADLRASAEEHWPRTWTTPALEEGKPAADLGDVALKPRGPAKDGIEVTASDETGRPVVGAKVAATTLPWGVYVTLGAQMAGISGVVSKEGVTDDLGRVRFFPLPPEKYDVVVRADGFEIVGIDNVVVIAGAVQHVRVTLKAGLSIQGRVVDREGAGVADAYVTGLQIPTFRSAERAMTDASGAFSLNGLGAGMYWMFAGHPDKGVGSANPKAGATGVRIELKGAGVLAGRVLGPDGAPVPKFTVRPWEPSEFRYVYSMSFSKEDPDGRFRIPLPPATYNVDVIAEGTALVTVQSVKIELDQVNEQTIKLPVSGVVKGVVTDPKGNHLAQAEVFLERGTPPVPVREQYVRTDAEGAFLLEGLPMESLKLHVRHAAYPVRIVDATPAPRSSAKELTVRLSEGARVEGRVTTKAGDAVSNARVNLFRMQRFDLFGAKTAFTDETGAFAFTGVGEDTYTVSVGRFENNASGPQKRVQVPGEGTVTVDLQVEGDAEATGTVTGRVLVGGVPAADATVEAHDERGPGNSVSGRTDAQGRYALKGFKPGRITAHVTTATGAEDWEGGRLAAPGQSVTIDFSLGAGSLRGVLVDADGRVTVSGGWITIERAEPGRATGWENVRAWIQSGNDGTFQATGLEPGTYRMRVGGTGFAVRVTDPFPVGDGEAKDLGSIRLQPGATISGRVTDDAGQPVEGAGVSVKNAKGEPVFLFSMVATGSDGRYSVPGLEPGAYVVLFDAKGFAPVERATTVGTTGGATVDAVLLSGGTLAAAVEDDRGRPLEGARVEVYDPRGVRITRTLTIVNFLDGDVSRTNAAGTATIPDLVPGTYTIKASKDGMVLVGDGVVVNVASHRTSNVRVVLRPRD